MYSTCLFCHRSLGLNRVIEAFPVGRRLAFDAEKGRLWAICPTCRRWNLTPMEERWEAIEACERTFRTLPLRTQTDEIGAAKHPEGLGLIRIGKPVSVELATWRFGEAMSQRLRRMAIYTGIAGAAGTIVFAAGLATGGLSGFLLMQGASLATRLRSKMNRVAVPLPAGEIIKVGIEQVDLLNPGDESTLGLRLRQKEGELRLYGRDAVRAASKVLPILNRAGARRKTVESAVAMVDEVGGGEAFLEETWGKARPKPGSGIRWAMAPDMKGGLIPNLPAHTRLGLEMAIQEEQERVVLASEMAELKAAWRQAEAVAQISDDLLLPRSIQDQLERLKGEENEG